MQEHNVLYGSSPFTLKLHMKSEVTRQPGSERMRSENVDDMVEDVAFDHIIQLTLKSPFRNSSFISS